MRPYEKKIDILKEGNVFIVAKAIRIQLDNSD
jgi:hypothetical protein